MNVIEIFAKFVMDTSDLDKGLDEANSKASSFGNGFSNVMGAVGTAAKVAAGAMVATAGAVGVVAQQASGAYSEYQQLAGGIETLFEDQQAVNAVMDNAANAYKTAGMSSNQYMDTVINMAASLNKATGDTVESARLADVAITDMSDNVNKMGTSMEMVQNAYRGFTRGNFTMLDNLALGYAGTKEGMQELLADAQAISGVEYDISSYADIVNAIHTVQENMGITGTTAAEAGETIQGSAGAMKAAWDNLILGLADPNADLGVLIENMVASAETALTNMIPTFTRAIEGIGQLVQGLAPVISSELPKLAESILPPLLDSAATLIDGVVKALPGLLSVIAEQLPPLINTMIEGIGGQLPTILQAVIDIITQLANSLSGMLPDLITMVTQIVVDLLAVITDPKNISAIIEAAERLVGGLFEGIFSALPILLDALPDMITGLLDGLLNSFEMLITDLWDEAYPVLFDLMPKVYQAFARFFPTLADKVLPLLKEFATTTLPVLVETWASMFKTEFPKVLTTMLPIIQDFLMGMAQAMTMFAEYLPIIIEALLPLIPVVVQALVDTLPIVLPILVDATMQLLEAFMEQWPVWMGAVLTGIGIIFQAILETTIENWSIVLNALVEAITPAVDAVMAKFEEWKIKLLEFFGPLLELLAPLFEAYGRYFEALGNLVDVVFTKIYEAVKSRLEDIQEIWETVWNAIMYFLQPILDDFTFWFEELLNIISAGVDDCIFWFEDMKTQIDTIIDNLINDALFWGKDLIENFVSSITNNMDLLTDGINGMTEFIDKNIGFSEPEEGPLSDFHTYAPDMMELFAKGVKDNKGLVKSAVSDAFNLGGMITGGMPTGGAQMPGLITPTASQPVQVTLVLDKQQLGKVVFDLNNQERQRVGVTLGKEAFA